MDLLCRIRDCVGLVVLALLVGLPPVGLGAQVADTVTLTLPNAMELAVKNNAGLLIAQTDVDEAAGTRARELAALLPRANGSAFVNRENRNLAVAGLSIPGVPTVVSPYTFMDFRVSASQTLIDRQAYHGWKASERAADATALTYRDVRDMVERVAAGLYLDAQTAGAEVNAADARAATSVALEELARDQRDQGLATGIDVVRAQVQLARDRQNALIARNASRTALLALARYLGLDLGRSIELADPLDYQPADGEVGATAIASALAARADYQALLMQRNALSEQRRSVADRSLPKLGVTGDYGALGRSFGALPGIGEVQATVSINLFDRDRGGEEQQVAARLRRLDEQIADLARGIEQELRQAALDLSSAAEQVDVAKAGLDLATRELDLAEDRFRNGVSDNVEVVAAQDALAQARDARIAALAKHVSARLAFARALGTTERFFNIRERQP